jgi:hypothetical protein
MVCYSETYKRDLKVIRKKNSKSEVRKQAGDEGENDIKLVNLRNRVKRITIEKLRLRDPKRKYKMRESEDKWQKWRIMHQSQQIAKVMNKKCGKMKHWVEKRQKKWLESREIWKKEARKAAGKGGKDIIPNIFQWARGGMTGGNADENSSNISSLFKIQSI